MGQKMGHFRIQVNPSVLFTEKVQGPPRSRSKTLPLLPMDTDSDQGSRRWRVAFRSPSRTALRGTSPSGPATAETRNRDRSSSCKLRYRSLVQLHASCRSVYFGSMGSQRLNITLDEAQAAKLSRLAARVHVNEGTLARSLLSTAIDDADPDPANVVAVLDGIDGAWERAKLGNRQAEAGKTISLNDL